MIKSVMKITNLHSHTHIYSFTVEGCNLVTIVTSTALRTSEPDRLKHLLLDFKTTMCMIRRAGGRAVSRNSVEISQNIFCAMETHQICVERRRGCNLPQMKTWNKQISYFHHVFHLVFVCLKFNWHSFNYVVSLCPLLLERFNGTQLENLRLS